MFFTCWTNLFLWYNFHSHVSIVTFNRICHGLSPCGIRVLIFTVTIGISSLFWEIWTSLFIKLIWKRLLCHCIVSIFRCILFFILCFKVFSKLFLSRCFLASKSHFFFLRIIRLIIKVLVIFISLIICCFVITWSIVIILAFLIIITTSILIIIVVVIFIVVLLVLLLVFSSAFHWLDFKFVWIYYLIDKIKL